MPAAVVEVRVAPGNSAATFSALAFCPAPYSTVVVSLLVDFAWLTPVTVNCAAFSASPALAPSPLTVVPL